MIFLASIVSIFVIEKCSVNSVCVCAVFIHGTIQVFGFRKTVYNEVYKYIQPTIQCYVSCAKACVGNINKHERKIAFAPPKNLFMCLGLSLL